LAASPRTWLVTGAAGFIGSNIVEDLLALGQKVIGLDNFSTGYRANLEEAVVGHTNGGSFRLIVGDIREAAVCRKACDGVDYVLHHAALGSVPRSIHDPLETNSVNVNGFLNMLVAAKERGVKRFVYASSSAVYGDSTDQPQLENSTGQSLSPYAASKAANETYADAFQASYGLQTIGLRYFNVFGRRQDPAGAYAAVIPRWIDNLIAGKPCQIFGDGQTTRDFCYISNVVQANILAATAHESASRQAYNVACGRSVTLNELFTMLKEELARDDPSSMDVSPDYQAFRAGDVRFSSASIEKARRMLSFSPTHDVGSGISEALPWYAGKRNSTAVLSLVEA
jgi:UDP-N-acetylglucosamine/UDP-N-acetylgalactosamine 4-epimerase